MLSDNSFQTVANILRKIIPKFRTVLNTVRVFTPNTTWCNQRLNSILHLMLVVYSSEPVCSVNPYGYLIFHINLPLI